MKRLAWPALLLTLSCTELAQPERPPSVTKDAVWAGGPDGGAWVDCGMSTKEPLTTFTCTVFDEQGAPWVPRRSFALVDRSTEGKYSLIEGPFHRVEPIGFDGDVIDVRGSQLLVPENWVERVGYDVKNWRIAWPGASRR